MDEYRKNVDILRKNRENVPLAELKQNMRKDTCRFAKGSENKQNVQFLQ